MLAPAPVAEELVEGISRQRGKSAGNDPTVSVSIVTLIEGLDKKLSDFIKSITDDKGLIEKRLNVVEANALIVEKMQRIQEQMVKDFAGFEDRFKDHERNNFHTTGAEALARLAADVENLKLARVTETALEDYIKSANAQNIENAKSNRTNRNWLIGIIVTLAIYAMTNVFPSIVRVIQALPTPVGGT